MTADESSRYILVLSAGRMMLVFLLILTVGLEALTYTTHLLITAIWSLWAILYLHHRLKREGLI